MWETVLKPPKPSALLGVSSPQLEESHTLHLCIWQRTAQWLTPALLSSLSEQSQYVGCPKPIRWGGTPVLLEQERGQSRHTKASPGQRHTETRPAEVPAFARAPDL